MKRPRLFRITNKRRILLNEIYTAINRRITSYSENGFARELVLTHETYSDERKRAELEKIDKKLEDLYLNYDVLMTVSSHSYNYDDGEYFFKKVRPWKTEWDIPLHIFNETIDETIDLLKEFQYNNVETEKINLLEQLKEFRNK